MWNEENELYWAAGFFDGEGSVCFRKRENKRNNPNKIERVTLQINQTNRETLERFQSAVGGVGNLYGPYQHHPQHRPVYRWQLDKESDLLRVCLILAPLVCAIKSIDLFLAIALLEGAKR